MKKILILFLAFILVGCGSKEVEVKTGEELLKSMNQNDYIIIDVRTVEEYNELHVKGAINIPVEEMTSYVELDKNKVLFVYCRSGKRSNTAYNYLKHYGYDVHDLGSINNITLEKE